MNKKWYWGIAALLILCLTVFVLILQRERAEIAQRQKEAEELLKQPKGVASPPQKQSTSPGHVHEDGSVHEDEHPSIGTPRDFEPALIQMPEGITDPDVKAAWERVEYISKHIWEWGGVPSQRAAELIDQLMPPPNGFEGENAHDDLEVTLELLSELKQYRDPRAAVVFATYTGEGIVRGEAMDEALVEIGLPSVPYLLFYIDPPYDIFVKNPGAAAFALGRIGAHHREELEGVIEHIIIPKLEALMKAKGPLMMLSKQYASESLDLLKK